MSTAALLPLRPLGTTTLRASVLGLGGCGLGDIYGSVTESDAVDTVLRALELGITLVDTSPNYGQGKSESRIGTALSTTATSPAVPLTLVTKCGDKGPQNGEHSPFSKQGVLSSFQCSQSRLYPGQVDVLLLHDPTLAELDEFFSPGTGGVEAFQELKRSGEVRATGIGVREHDVLARFMTHPTSVADIILPVNDWNLLRRYASANILPLAKQLGICVLNGGPLYMGLLAGVPPKVSFSEGIKSEIEAPRLLALASQMHAWSLQEGIDLRALALRFATGMWPVDEPGADAVEIAYGIRSPQNFAPPIASALVGAKSPLEIEEVVRSFEAVTVGGGSDWMAVAFEEEFGLSVEALANDDHWFYNKAEVVL
jgi:D-threo-aldose 1-dehydrogenase